MARRFGAAAIGLTVACLALRSRPWLFEAPTSSSPVVASPLERGVARRRGDPRARRSTCASRATRAVRRTALPRGTLIAFSGVPAHAGRRLFLTDGANEIPMVEDGHGRLVARWPLGESADLRIVARFGQVSIQEPDVTPVTSIADRAPEVTLEGAPRRVMLATEPTSEIPIRYEVTDDHGLREVHLVLRSGTREERRVLARLDGEARTDRGGHVLRTTDPFVKKSHAPIEICVEAKDNDPVTGPKWGRSAAITLIPPDVGEPEALRMTKLRELRDQLVDALAWRMAHAVPGAAAERAEFVRELVKGADALSGAMESTLTGSYAGARIPSRLSAILRGQMRKVRTAVDAEARAPSAARHAETVKATERIVLVVDAILRGLDQRDARDVARQLADVADELAQGLSLTGRGEAADAEARVRERVDASTVVLRGGEDPSCASGRWGGISAASSARISRVARARREQDRSTRSSRRAISRRAAATRRVVRRRGRSGAREAAGGGARGRQRRSGDGPGRRRSRPSTRRPGSRQPRAGHAGGINDVDSAGGASSDEELRQAAEEAKKRRRGAGGDEVAAQHRRRERLVDEQRRGARARRADGQLCSSTETRRTRCRARPWLRALDERPSGRRRASVVGVLSRRRRRGAQTLRDEARRRAQTGGEVGREESSRRCKRAAERAASQLSQHGERGGQARGPGGEVGERGREQGVPPRRSTRWKRRRARRGGGARAEARRRRSRARSPARGAASPGDGQGGAGQRRGRGGRARRGRR